MNGTDGPYHHGNLREALLQAGMELVRERGVDGFTLREVARRANVSHAAPYHHFRNKAHLIEALAIDGFAEFTRVLRRAWERPANHALDRLRAVGIAYVRFALEHKARFRLMNRPELRVADPQSGGEDGGRGSVQEAAAASYAVLLDGIRACQEQGLVPAGDPGPLALASWSSVHGLAVLIMDGLLRPGDVSPDEGEKLAEAVTGVLGIGLLGRGERR